MLVMVVFFIAFRWIHLSTPLIRLFPLVLILLLMPTLNFLPVWFALSLDRKSGSAGMPRPISYAVFCLKKKIYVNHLVITALFGPLQRPWHVRRRRQPRSYRARRRH